MRGRVRVVYSIVSAMAVFAGVAVFAVTASAQVTAPVTVTVSSVVAFEDPDPFPGQGAGDFYGRVTINGGSTMKSSEVGDDNTIDPFWVFTADVDIASSPIPITIEVLDSDGFGFEPDDVLDINPVDAKTSLTLLLDVTTGTWTFDGDPVSDNATSATGDGDTGHFDSDEGGEKGQIFFDISVISDSGDADGDGLLDGWETNGYDADGDGSIDVDLPAFGADPYHKDLFVELDYEEGASLERWEIQEIKEAFANAPIGAGTNASSLSGGTDANINPDGLPGITLWIDMGPITERGIEDGTVNFSCNDGIDNGGDGYTDGDDPDCLVADNLGGGNLLSTVGACKLDSDFYAAKAANFDPSRRLIFRYGISANRPPECDSSGGWGEIGGNDFIDFNNTGATVMHELGHTLNLEHGGFEANNCKPNYVSIMNYAYSAGIQKSDTSGGMLDYSPPRYAGTRSAALPPALAESNLSELIILDPLDTENHFVFSDGTGSAIRGPINAEADWNGDGDTDDTGVTVNVDDLTVCPSGSSDHNLKSHDDWSTISLQFHQFGDSADGPIDETPDPEPTTSDLLELEELLNTADVDLTMSDSADPVAAGEPVTYSLTVKNNGPNPASDVEITQTLPERVTYLFDNPACDITAGTVTCDVGEVLAGGQATIDVSILVDADLVFDVGGPTTIVSSAVVTNLAGPDPDPSNNTASETTSVVGEADLKIVAYDAINAPAEILVGDLVDVTTRTLIVNNGPSTPMDVALVSSALGPEATTISPGSVATTEPALDGEHRELSDTYELSCTEANVYRMMFNTDIAPLHTADTERDHSDNTAELAIDVECVVPVQINIKPGGDPNPVNPDQGIVAVAVLSTAAGEYGLPLAFDATRIDPLSVRFGPRDVIFAETGGAFGRHHAGHWEDSLELDDATHDGDIDLVRHFRAAETGIATGDTEACVKGTWVDDAGLVHKFFGCDAIRITPDLD